MTTYEPTSYQADPDETVTCPECGLKDDSDAHFCDQCGFKLDGAIIDGEAYAPTPYQADPDETVECPVCDRFNDLDASYCDQCGTKLAGRDDVSLRKSGRKKTPRTRSLAERRKALHSNGKRTTRTFARPLESGQTAEGRAFGGISTGGTEVTLNGHVIVWNVPYTVYDCYGAFTETIHTNAAQNLDADVRFMYDHDSLVMARTASGTLTLANDDIGLAIAAKVDTRQSFTNDLVIAIDRRDVTQMSVGFICVADVWSADGMTRDIYAIEVVDVSAVGIPASPTTDISIQQNASNQLAEARSRLRDIEARVGKVLSQANQDRLTEGATALAAVHDADDEWLADLAQWFQDTAQWAESLGPVGDWISAIDEALDEAQAALADVLGTANPDDDESDETAPETDSRSQRRPATSDERRAATLSFGDQQALVYQSLVSTLQPTFPDGRPVSSWFDLWIEDIGTDWVVFESWEPYPGNGLWQIAYSIDPSGAVVFDGEPVQVVEQTSYVPVPSPVDADEETRERQLQMLDLKRARLSLAVGSSKEG